MRPEQLSVVQPLLHNSPYMNRCLESWIIPRKSRHRKTRRHDRSASICIGSRPFFAGYLTGMAVVRRPQRRCRRPFMMMLYRGAEDKLHAPLRSNRIPGIIGVEHGDYRCGPIGVASGPLTVDERVLHCFPVLSFRWNTAVGLRQGAITYVTVHGAKKLNELLEIHTHLKYQLAQRHLLRPGQLVEIATIGLCVLDRLDRRDAQ